MPRESDPQRIRRVLETDRSWSAYALGDLSPGHWEYSEWHVAASEGALLLLYREPQPPVLFTLGPAPAVGALLDEIADEPAFYLSIRPEVLPETERRWSTRDVTPMCRMVLESTPPVDPGSPAVRLTPRDLEPLLDLYADGQETGEAPDFFFPSMLEQGVFYGIREGGTLVAVAGTHLVSREESVAAIGNVYTRRSHRGRGLGTLTTAAVAAKLRRLGVRTVVLNVKQSNTAALRAYARVGFRTYCSFLEGTAYR